MSDPVDFSIVYLLTRMDAALGLLLCMSFALLKLGATAFKPVIHQCLCGSSRPSIVKSCLLIEGVPWVSVVEGLQHAVDGRYQ